MNRMFLSILLIGLCLPLASKAADVAPLTAAGCEEFGFDFYRKLVVTEPYRFEANANVAISPYSLASVLQALLIGATGQTEGELSRALKIQEIVDQKPALVVKPDDLENKAVQFYVGNSLWVDNRFAVKPSFVQETKKQLNAAVFSVDFRDAGNVAGQINTWISDCTAGHIKDLVTPDAVSGASLAIANAVYFKAEWEKPFDAKLTKDEPFQLASGNPVQIPMMNKEANCPYAEKDGVKVLQLPYAGSEVSMVLLLPELGEKAWKAMEENLTDHWLQNAIGKLENRSVTIKLPRWKITCQPPDCIAVLKSMGIKKIFVPSGDFKGISDLDDLYVSAFLHRTWMEVNEKGTEAAAATTSHLTVMAIAQPPKSATFIADHPFFFVIRHNATGTPLFVGRVANPAEKKP